MIIVFTAVSALAAALSCAAAVGSIWLVLRQARGAEELAKATADANNIATRVAQINLLVDFSKRFHEIRGDMPFDFSNEIQADQFWNLHHLEFYAFRSGAVPVELYGHWMIDLAGLFVREEPVWRSHRSFLERYREGYREMYDFFLEIHEMCVRYETAHQARDEAVLDLVKTWFPDPAKSLTSPGVS
jgi:hypothetical protein